MTKQRPHLKLRDVVPKVEGFRRRICAQCMGLSALVCLASACSSKLVIATWACPQSSDAGRTGSTPNEAGDSIEVPWSTGFEDGSCDYSASGGFCFATGVSSFQIVTSPVRSGQYAAAFSVTTGSDAGSQVRCVRQGTLPIQAYYGAWYYVPSLSTNNNGVWNLFHFQGPPSSSSKQGLWDISLINNDSGGLRLVVYQFPITGVTGGTPDMSSTPAIPIGKWFHIVMLLKRASDATGEVQVFQDDVSVLHLTGIITDDSEWAQWYVGNLATNLSPPESTLYVDDVSITDTL